MLFLVSTRCFELFNNINKIVHAQTHVKEVVFFRVYLDNNKSNKRQTKKNRIDQSLQLIRNDN